MSVSGVKRVSGKGVLLDRSKSVAFTFNGRTYHGYSGDTLSSALLANDRHFVGRSFKYHRPRGILASGVEEPNALFGTGEGATFEPNQRGSMVALYDGLVARSQNHVPSLEFDIGAANSLISSVFPAGFYYKTFIKPRAAWKHLFEPVIRRAAGLGKAPTQPDKDRYEHFYVTVDVLVAGGGVAGVLAAKAAAATGARVLLAEQSPYLGGRVLVDAAADQSTINGTSSDAWLQAQIESLQANPNVAIRTHCQVSAVQDHAYALLYERVHDRHQPKNEGPRLRLWRVRAGQVVMATGAIERPIAFANNDKPGVMLASAVRDYLELYGVATGDQIVVFTNNDDAYRTALTLHSAGVCIKTIIDSRAKADSALVKRVKDAGLDIRFGYGVVTANGGRRVSSVAIAKIGDTREVSPSETIACDCVAMSGGWSPAAHLWSHAGGKLYWDDVELMFRPDHDRPAIRHDGAAAVVAAGAADGEMSLERVALSGWRAGRSAAELGGFRSSGDFKPTVEEPNRGKTEPLWFTPAPGRHALGSKHFIDFQNDVTAADVKLAAQEGYESVEHAKRYTTLGMATDQGKTSNINGLAVLSDALKKAIPEVGTTTFRPPYTPIAFGSIAGYATKKLFKAIRRTPLYGWHSAQKTVLEPVGDWRRPYAYRTKTPEGRIEDVPSAINREIMATRRAVSLLDASTLGKIVVKGPDAGAFLDLMYTHKISTLKPGKCRYALMCNDNGYLFDDGVVVRLDNGSDGDDQTFLCHTTSGGSDRVHAWMEEWLQTEWPAMRVFTQNVTDQFAQIAVAGPKARALLRLFKEEPHAPDVSDDALPFMHWVEARIAGCPARIYRISFSGELSFEIATPASYGLALWKALLEKGAPLGVTPIGTESLHVMRAEKGFIAIGDETDGTVTPYDLNMGWAVSKKKDDFIGMRALQRPFLTDPNRKRLVGLLTEDPTAVLPIGAHAVQTVCRTQRMQTIGHVTSSYFSPTLARSIAMALIQRGPDRLGETVSFPLERGKIVRAKIVETAFYDKENARQKV
jgi:sarcosine oxidase subunit alpha